MKARATHVKALVRRRQQGPLDGDVGGVVRVQRVDDVLEEGDGGAGGRRHKRVHQGQSLVGVVRRVGLVARSNNAVGQDGLQRSTGRGVGCSEGYKEAGAVP